MALYTVLRVGRSEVSSKSRRDVLGWAEAREDSLGGFGVRDLPEALAYHGSERRGGDEKSREKGSER